MEGPVGVNSFGLLQADRLHGADDGQRSTIGVYRRPVTDGQ
jgi:hypothetical protein